MSEQNATTDRRTLLKILGSAGATSAFFSACGKSITTASADSRAGLTGGKWEKTISLATAGPGGNPNWQAGDAVKFLPPEKIATHGRAADVLASLPKDKLLTIYQRMNASRKWETAMKDLFVGGKDGLYGAFHTYVGEEAMANGVMAALNDDDYIRTNHGGVGDRGAWHDIPERNGSVWLGELKVRYDAILAKHPKLDHGNHANHLGTLGTGNHFIEVCLDESETVWFMLHSGSRGVGNRMGSLGFEDGRNHKRSKTLASVAARAVGFGFGVALIGCAPRPGHVSRGLHAHFSINCCRSQPGSALPLRQAQARAMDPE